MRHMILLPLLALTVGCTQGADNSNHAQAKVADAPYPAIAVLDAFRVACTGAESQAKVREAAIAAGWSVVADPATTPIAENLARGRAMVESMLKNERNARSDRVVLTRIVEEQTLYLLLTEVVIDGFSASECRLYDPGETRSIPTETSTQWVGSPPSQSVNQPDGAKDVWSRALDGGEGIFSIARLAEGSTPATIAGYHGLMITTDHTPTSQTNRP